MEVNVNIKCCNQNTFHQIEFNDKTILGCPICKRLVEVKIDINEVEPMKFGGTTVKVPSLKVKE